MIENTVKIWRLNVRKRAAHVRGSAPLSLLLAMWTWGKLTYGLKNMINLLLLYCRADQCESDGNYRNSVNTLVYSYLLLWQHLPRWEWYLCRMLGPLPVCTWLDGVLSKNGMILSRRDGFASYFNAENSKRTQSQYVCVFSTYRRLGTMDGPDFWSQPSCPSVVQRGFRDYLADMILIHRWSFQFFSGSVMNEIISTRQ